MNKGNVYEFDLSADVLRNVRRVADGGQARLEKVKRKEGERNEADEADDARETYLQKAQASLRGCNAEREGERVRLGFGFGRGRRLIPDGDVDTLASGQNWHGPM